MITIINQPPLFNYSKNPIVVKANTDKYLSDEGSAAVCKFFVGDYPDYFEDTTVDIATILFTQRFTFDQTGENTATNIVFDGTVTNQVTAIAYIAKRLRQNYYINKYYTITTGFEFGAEIVILTAKENGTQYSTTTTVTDLAGDSDDTAGTDPVATGVSLLLQVMQYPSARSTSTDATMIGSRTVYPDLDGNIEEDISDIIDDYLEYELITTDLTLPYLISKSNNRYYITVSELGVELAVDDSINEIGVLTPTTDFFAIKGGVSKSEFVSESFDLTGGIVGKTKTFLTNYPLARDIRLDETIIIFFAYAGSSLAGIRYYAVLEDESISEELGTWNLTDPADGIIFQIPLKVNKAYYDYIESTTGKKIVEVYARILDGTGFVSENIYLNVDKKYNKYFNQLILKNSEGAYEFFPCKGQFKISADIDYSILDKTLPTTYTNQDFQQARTKEFHTKPVLMNTGHLKSKEEKRWLAELIIKGSGFHVVNNVVYPIIITNKKIVIEDTTEDVYSYDIEFVYSYSNASY